MSTKLEVLRWVLIVPSAIFVWYVCLILGLFSLPILDYFCPPELIVSGACFAEWHQTAENIFIAFFASLSAVLIVTSSVSLAPYKKKEVAIISFLIGFIVAIYMAYKTQERLLLAVVSFAGAATSTFFSLKFTNAS